MARAGISDCVREGQRADPLPSVHASRTRFTPAAPPQAADGVNADSDHTDRRASRTRPGGSSGRRLLLVSNRLPVAVRVERGELVVAPSAGGLATGLRAVH